MGIRTPGLVIANDALYQLSYTPPKDVENITMPAKFHHQSLFLFLKDAS
jgi:hypothetical protein